MTSLRVSIPLANTIRRPATATIANIRVVAPPSTGLGIAPTTAANRGNSPRQSRMADTA